MKRRGDDAELSAEDLQTLTLLLATVNTEESQQALARIHHHGSTRGLPEDVWRLVVAQLPLEDRARLAGVNHYLRDLVTQMAVETKTGGPGVGQNNNSNSRIRFRSSCSAASAHPPGDAHPPPSFLTPTQRNDRVSHTWMALSRPWRFITLPEHTMPTTTGPADFRHRRDVTIRRQMSGHSIRLSTSPTPRAGRRLLDAGRARFRRFSVAYRPGAAPAAAGPGSMHTTTANVSLTGFRQRDHQDPNCRLTSPHPAFGNRLCQSELVMIWHF